MPESPDLEKRVMSLEMKGEWVTGEIASLRASRHEHGNWLNRHNLEINALDQTLKELYQQRLSDVEKGLLDMKATVDGHGKSIGDLTANAKVLAWKIGVILAGIVFVANQLAERVKF